MENNYLENNLSMTLEEWLKYHQNNLHFKQKYRGIQMMKNPFDLIIYEELISKIKPDIIIEIGTSQGGFALWLADRLKLYTKNGKVVTIDLEKAGKENIEKFNYDNIISIIGDCNSLEVINKAKENISESDVVLVIEDSAHTPENTLKVLNNFKDSVTIGSYLIVEDSICDVLKIEFMPGPLEAIEKWIKNNGNYLIDRSCEKYIITYNPKGYLKRKE